MVIPGPPTDEFHGFGFALVWNLPFKHFSIFRTTCYVTPLIRPSILCISVLPVSHTTPKLEPGVFSPLSIFHFYAAACTLATSAAKTSVLTATPASPISHFALSVQSRNRNITSQVQSSLK